MTQFFGYWGGRLPAVADLHFRSFVHFHPCANYDLWLDEDVGSHIPAELSWIKTHEKISIKYFSLSSLIDRYVNPLNNSSDSRVFNLMRFIHRKKILRHINVKSYYHPLFKINYKHSSLLFTYKKDLVYRSDLARCIIPVAHYKSASLYSDLDVCFLSNLNNICLDEGFLYRWKNYNFANSAILYSPNHSVAKNILNEGNLLECFRPWYLFSDSVCERLNMKIYPCSQFDAMWDSKSLLFGDAEKFFEKSALSQQMVQDLFEKKYIANHWHNNWQATPVSGSPYDLLLNLFNPSKKNP